MVDPVKELTHEINFHIPCETAQMVVNAITNGHTNIKLRINRNRVLVSGISLIVFNDGYFFPFNDANFVSNILEAYATTVRLLTELEKKHHELG